MIKLEKIFKKVHEDARGEIYTLTGFLPESREITIFTTNKGFVRGGCIHRDSKEYSVVLDGVVEYYMKDRKTEIYKKGDSFLVPQNTPHYYVSLTDSIVAEWYPKPEEKEEKFPEFRSIVDRMNAQKLLQLGREVH